jgi:hypothetical protein
MDCRGFPAHQFPLPMPASLFHHVNRDLDLNTSGDGELRKAEQEARIPFSRAGLQLLQAR